MEIVLLKQARADKEYWIKTGNKQIIKRITELLKDIQSHPFSGIGKPEPLKGTNGKWSRRITDEHRLIYSISEGRIYIFVFSMRFHYS